MSEATTQLSIQPFIRETEHRAVFCLNKDSHKKRYMHKRQNERLIVIDLTLNVCLTSTAGILSDFIRSLSDHDKQTRWPASR